MLVSPSFLAAVSPESGAAGRLPASLDARQVRSHCVLAAFVASQTSAAPLSSPLPRSFPQPPLRHSLCFDALPLRRPLSKCEFPPDCLLWDSLDAVADWMGVCHRFRKALKHDFLKDLCTFVSSVFPLYTPFASFNGFLAFSFSNRSSTHQLEFTNFSEEVALRGL